LSGQEEEDSELENLKAKRLAEMQKNLSSKQNGGSGTADTTTASAEPQQEKTPENPRDLVVPRLGFRGLEVLENAESQFPNETRIVVKQLAELIKSGELPETLDGGKLLALFRAVGLHVRMATKINVEQDGKFVSLSDKLKTQSNSEGDNDGDNV